jgi:xylulokinase
MMTYCDARVMFGAGPVTVTAGVDIGTTSVKAAAFDDDGRVVARTRVPHRVVVPEPDRLEHDANQAWRRGPRRALAGLVPTPIDAVAVCSMVPSLTAVDRGGRALAPGLLYGDARGHTELAHLGPGGDGSVVPMLGWLSDAVPDAAGFWPATAVASRSLGDEAVIDYGVAFTASPFFGADGWDPQVGQTCGVRPEQMPRVDGPGAPIGRLDRTGAVVATGSVDGLCEQLVAGAVQPGDVHVICGTTLIVWVVLPEWREIPGLWTIPHPDMTTMLAGGASNAGGLFLDWVGRLLGQSRDQNGYDVANLPVWIPYVRGERVPHHDPSRRAELVGLDLTHGAAALTRAGWEASGFVVRQLAEMAGVEPRRLVATGGGTRVEGWMQALADAVGVPVHVSAVPETAAQGAAFMARFALGLESALTDAARWASTGRVVDPDPAGTTAAAGRYRRFLESARATPA